MGKIKHQESSLLTHEMFPEFSGALGQLSQITSLLFVYRSILQIFNECP